MLGMSEAVQAVRNPFAHYSPATAKKKSPRAGPGAFPRIEAPYGWCVKEKVAEAGTLGTLPPVPGVKLTASVSPATTVVELLISVHEVAVPEIVQEKGAEAVLWLMTVLTVHPTPAVPGAGMTLALRFLTPPLADAGTLT